jgi:hypothetical protein
VPAKVRALASRRDARGRILMARSPVRASSSSPNFAARFPLTVREGGNRPLGLQHPPQQLDILGERAIGGAQLLDLAHGVHDRGVVAAAEFAADLGQ